MSALMFSVAILGIVCIGILAMCIEAMRGN